MTMNTLYRFWRDMFGEKADVGMRQDMEIDPVFGVFFRLLRFFRQQQSIVYRVDIHVG